MIADYLPLVDWALLLPLLQPDNAVVVTLCLETGLRVGDAVALPLAALEGDTLTYTAAKTGKGGSVKLHPDTAAKLKACSGAGWIFPSRTSKSGHRTRQAVWHDVKKAAAAAGVSGNIAPHSARKTFAVETLHQSGLGATKKALQHSSTFTTLLYALSDLTRRETASPGEQQQFADLVARRVIELLYEALRSIADDDKRATP